MFTVDANGFEKSASSRRPPGVQGGCAGGFDDPVRGGKVLGCVGEREVSTPAVRGVEGVLCDDRYVYHGVCDCSARQFAAWVSPSGATSLGCGCGCGFARGGVSVCV